MKNLYRKWIGDRLKALREQTGWTQEELADKIGKFRRTYAKYEDADAEPSIYTIKKLCKEFGITIDEFMAGSPVEPSIVG